MAPPSTSVYLVHTFIQVSLYVLIVYAVDSVGIGPELEYYLMRQTLELWKLRRRTGMNKIAFATVGSTKFDGLIRSVLSDDTLASLKACGYGTLVVQAGNSAIDLNGWESEVDDNGMKVSRRAWHGIAISLWSYKDSLEGDYLRADLVICHAGMCYGKLLLPLLTSSKVLERLSRRYEWGKERSRFRMRHCCTTTKKN